VNFFGHAVVASYRSNDAGFVLGAMLPDFATMLGARPPEASGTLALGIAFHHETDRVFHDSPAFRRLQAEARRTLREMGLSRPSALAVGHIGVEILLDAALAEDRVAVAAYLSALDAAGEARVTEQIAWNDAALGKQFDLLCGALRARGVTAETRRAESTALRVTRALATRPRLRLEGDGERIVREWAEATGPAVAAEAPAWLDDIRQSLALSGLVRPGD
jgi:hypothetical protein